MDSLSFSLYARESGPSQIVAYFPAEKTKEMPTDVLKGGHDNNNNNNNSKSKQHNNKNEHDKQKKKKKHNNNGRKLLSCMLPL